MDFLFEKIYNLPSQKALKQLLFSSITLTLNIKVSKVFLQRGTFAVSAESFDPLE